MSQSGQPHRLPTDTAHGMLLIISGPSGVGKTTITRGVERSIPGAVFSVSVTTRAKTPADVEGVDYFFIDDEAFEELRRTDRLLESADIYGKKYGTPREWVQTQLDRGRLVILEIDVQGARQVKSRVPGAYAVFILPPNEEALLQRLRARKREDESVIQRRFAEARREIEAAHASGVYDAFLVNENLDDALGRAVDLVRGEMHRRRGG